MHRWSRKTVATPVPLPNPNPSPNDGRPKRPPHLCQNRVYYPLNRESGVLARTRAAITYSHPYITTCTVVCRMALGCEEGEKIAFREKPERRTHVNPVGHPKDVLLSVRPCFGD